MANDEQENIQELQFCKTFTCNIMQGNATWEKGELDIVVKRNSYVLYIQVILHCNHVQVILSSSIETEEYQNKSFSQILQDSKLQFKHIKISIKVNV